MNKDDDIMANDLPFFGIPKLKFVLAKYRKSLLAISALQMSMSILDVTRPVMQRYALDHIVGQGRAEAALPFAGVYLLIILAISAIGYAMVKVTIKVDIGISRDMRKRAFAHLQELSFDYFNQNSVGYIHSRVMSDTGRIGELFSWYLADGVYFLFYIISAVAVMLSINLKLTGLILLVVPAIAFFFSLFEDRLFALNKQIREVNSVITGNLNEGIAGAKTIKSLSIEEKIGSDFRKETEKMKRLVLKSARLNGAFSVVTNLASSCGLAIVLWRGGILAAEQVGVFSMFMSYAQDLMEPVRWMVEILSYLVQTRVNIGRYTRLVEQEPGVKDSPEVVEKYGDCFNPKKENWEELKGDIEFEHVDFKYPDGEEYILRDFNLKIPFGTSLAIVGETGAGKSTLANLICRFYEPTAGRVLIDGRDARERSQLWLHSALGYVLQTPHLFTGTIRENLLYGNPEATEEEIQAAIKLVSADEVIAKLEKGLDSEVGEGGDMLSTGEKQLISFARAILASPKIVVLDEATASVDTLTEQRIQEAIDKVIKGRTSVVIAHRLSTVKDADIILVVEYGKIVEQGDHRQLLSKKGHYHKLWMRQYEDKAIFEAFSESAAK